MEWRWFNNYEMAVCRTDNFTYTVWRYQEALAKKGWGAAVTMSTNHHTMEIAQCDADTWEDAVVGARQQAKAWLHNLAEGV
jgi:hypothetical protein